MKFSFLSILFAAMLFCGCSADDEQNGIEGSWKLTHTTGREGVSVNFNQGEVIWTFYGGSGTVAIENNSALDNNSGELTGISSGLYPYSTRKENNNQVLYINNVAQGIYAYDNDNLVIRTVPSENVVKIFERQP